LGHSFEARRAAKGEGDIRWLIRKPEDDLDAWIDLSIREWNPKAKGFTACMMPRNPFLLHAQRKLPALFRRGCATAPAPPGGIVEAAVTECIMVSRIGSFEWTRKALGPPGEAEVLVRVEVTGLCRTDLKLIRHGHRDLVLPRIPGEEVVGRIAAMGPGVRGFATGDRVYLYPGAWCGRCRACARGAHNLCREMRIMGFHRDGGFAGEVIAPAQSLIHVPPGLAPEAAVLAEPLSCCLNALELGGARPGERVGVWGAGPAGLLLARAAGAMGAEAVNIEPDARRRAFCGGIPDGGGRSFDLCVVAAGVPQAYQEALAHLAPRGRLVVFSGLLPAEDALPVSLNRLHYHEQTLVGAYGCTYRHGLQALAWLAQGSIAVQDLISHRLPLRNLEAALELVENRRGIKILLYPASEGALP
jgi:L-iditol 2-dehydrogenase